ncbi:secreted glycosyl hydrolase [Paraphoma chrysanthemicola]|uniref:Secreted glycosyl hydrolase n=1 Tax=Paraphoma chrysanthemicola TaxID=798071 RepID=A0A8K0W4W5_9PLEO|nr:secreted glycosyl hydrolase [Paraphoma chrysanthemicola]
MSPFRVLVFSKTSGYRHASIPAGISCFQSLAARTNLFSVTASEDASLFTPESLSKYAVIVLLQTSGNIFNQEQLDALKGFVGSGGGVLGIHSAASGMPEDEWYGRLIGAHFDMHPPAEHGTVLPSSSDNKHFTLASSSLPKHDWLDEYYNFYFTPDNPNPHLPSNLTHATPHPAQNPTLTLLLKGDLSTFAGSKMGSEHPLAWCQEFEGGRSWYIALGHFDEAWANEWFVGMVGRGLIWCARREKEAEIGVKGFCLGDGE